jgi:hypothetical protein
VTKDWKDYLVKKAWPILGSPWTLENGPFRIVGKANMEPGDVLVFRCLYINHFQFF